MGSAPSTSLHCRAFLSCPLEEYWKEFDSSSSKGLFEEQDGLSWLLPEEDLSIDMTAVAAFPTDPLPLKTPLPHSHCVNDNGARSSSWHAMIFSHDRKFDLKQKFKHAQERAFVEHDACLYSSQPHAHYLWHERKRIGQYTHGYTRRLITVQKELPYGSMVGVAPHWARYCKNRKRSLSQPQKCGQIVLDEEAVTLYDVILKDAQLYGKDLIQPPPSKNRKLTE